MPSAPAYTRLSVDKRRRLLIDTGSELFARHAFEEISMREIASAAGVSKGLLYHYFPSKTALFTAAVAEYAAELAQLLQPDVTDPPIEQLARTLERYLSWIEEHSGTWTKLMQSAGSVPEARAITESFRAQTLQSVLARLSPNAEPAPVLRNALRGWLGYIDAAIVDWVTHRDLSRDQLRDSLTAAFVASVDSAQRLDPDVRVALAERTA